MISNRNIQNIIPRRTILIILTITSNNIRSLTSIINCVNMNFTLWVDEIEESGWDGGDWIVLVCHEDEGFVELEVFVMRRG